jgi:hypothetical protein
LKKPKKAKSQRKTKTKTKKQKNKNKKTKNKINKAFSTSKITIDIPLFLEDEIFHKKGHHQIIS